ncbi:MAG: NAD(P)-dependent oxidoreductase [Chloroflexota bacterium]
MAVKRVGLIGLGLMGHGLGKNLLKHGFTLTVFDMNPAAVERLVKEGAAAADSPKAVAQASEVVITVLPDGPDVEAAVLGPEGIMSGAQPGLLLMDCSSIDPAVTQRLGATLRAAGCRMVDAAMGRGADEAEAGKLAFMVGATDEDLATARPLLEAMGDKIIHCGGPSAGITAKVINNLLASTILAADMEALSLAAKAGLRLDMMLELLSSTAANNDQLRTTIGRVVDGEFEPGFKAWLAHKDAGLAENLAARMAVPLFVLAPARQLLSAVLAEGHGDRASYIVGDLLQRLAGVRIKR